MICFLCLEPYVGGQTGPRDSFQVLFPSVFNIILDIWCNVDFITAEVLK
jgi:hypothetical protein